MVVRLPKQHGVLEMEVEDLIVSEEYGEYSSSSRTSDDGAVATALSFIKRKARVASLIFLAIVVGILLLQMDSTVTTDVMEESEDVQKKEIIATHGNSFGGINNIASPGGAKAAANMEGAAFADIIIPQSNVGHATPSLNRANILNLVGHYVHDEHRSPYSSHLYDKPQEFLDKQQDLYLAKMKRVREEWGAWGFQDPNKNGRQAPSFEGVPYKDLQRDQFPASSWQADEHYNAEFLKEAKALVKRMQHGIYAEYGWPLKDGMTQEELEEHSNLWKIHVDDDPEFGNYKQGIAVLSKVAMDGLVRKLLHAMMTHDEFYAVLGGHSAAAGHGNDFQQNRIMTFHRIMEPVFDKLGMRLVSRNMGMGGVGTLQFSLAGGDLYGEADILEWDSGMTEKGPPVDLFNKQAILSGERVPLIITSQHDDIKEETNGLAYMGKYIEDKSIFPQTTLENENEIPYAAQWYDEQHTKYNAICWEPRSDFEPPTNQKDSPGSQVGWHPGNRHHTWQGRKLALVVLHALSIALDTWETAIEEKGVPLEESYWHVGMRYAAIRDKLRRHLTTPKSNDVDQDVRSKCEAMMPWLPRVCRVQMHGFGMWTPRVLQDFDFLNLIHPAPNGYKPDYPIENVYHGFDLLPLNQALADDQVDVHAIAIATNNSPPDLDHSWTEGEEGQDSDGPANRRWLREASEKAMLWGPTLEAEERQKRRNIEVATHREQMLERELNEDDIVPGRGWEVGALFVCMQSAIAIYLTGCV